jgi:hypothetical protein
MDRDRSACPCKTSQRIGRVEQEGELLEFIRANAPQFQALSIRMFIDACYLRLWSRTMGASAWVATATLICASDKSPDTSSSSVFCLW